MATGGGPGGIGAGTGGAGRIAVFHKGSVSIGSSNPSPYSGDFATPTATFTPTITPTPTTMALPVTAAGWQGAQYSYEGAQPHAVTSVQRGAGEDSFVYDTNGNMTQRVEGGVTWTQTFNSENRLASISNGTDTWIFVYDGDGNRVKQINPDETVTLFLAGGSYTVVDASGDPEVTRYYSIAGQRVALNGPDGLQYLLTDHLGSVSAVLTAGGVLVENSEQRYMPFGAERLLADEQTDFGYTGQRDLAAVGLMDYNARWYDAGLGRWTQPDLMNSGNGNPQNLNRFSYTVDNPIRFIDPSGHVYCAPDEPCNGTSDSKASVCYYCSYQTRSESNNNQETLDEDLKASEENYCKKHRWECETADILGYVAVGADLLAGGASLSGAIAVDVSIAIGFVQGCAVGAATGMPFAAVGTCISGAALAGAEAEVLTNATLGAFENTMSGIGTLLTISSDILLGRTQFDLENRSLRLGGDTIVSARNFVAGLFPEANVDLMVNYFQIKYDLARLNGMAPRAAFTLNW